MAATRPPKPPYTTTAPYTVATCPVCSEPIKADVTIEVTYGDAIVHSAQDVQLQVSPKLIGFSLIHECTGPTDAEPKDGGPTS
jgi:hypothetical protein